MTRNYNNIITQFDTLLDFLRFGVSEANRHQLYYGHGTDNPEDDIKSLVLASLCLPFDTRDLLLQARLTTEEKEYLTKQLIRRIHEKIPVPYLINLSYFCDLPFYVDNRVLIPRSPIAELINQQFTPWLEVENVQNVLDLCTGSGCIAIACHYAFPDASIIGIDLSESALQVAEINRQRHGLDEEQLMFIQSDCWTKVPHKQYDLIVSNPPYVGDEEMDTLPAEYLHEPDMALRTGKNGLEIVEKILENAHRYLTDEGILVVEVGNSDLALAEAYPDLPFIWLEFENGGQGVFLLTCEQLKTYFAG